jgi:hypothetical protein
MNTTMTGGHAVYRCGAVKHYSADAELAECNVQFTPSHIASKKRTPESHTVLTEK